MSKLRITIPFLCIMLIGCTSQSSDKQDRRIGGCVLDTINVGLSFKGSATAGRTPDRITIKATKDPGKDLFALCAGNLTDILDSIGIMVYERSDIIHIVSGPCWPAYSIVFRVDGSGGRFDRLREELLAIPVAGHFPSDQRPEEYGSFFITAGRGSSDLWTVWYPEKE